MNQFVNTVRVGWFLAVAQIKRAGRLTTILTIAVMVFSFLAQVFISGILIGLIEGSSVAFRAKYIGDMIVSPLEKKEKIERTFDITSNLDNNPNVASYSVRFTSAGQIDANSATRSSGDSENTKGANIYGIVPSKEDATTKLSESIVEGDYLTDTDSAQYVLVGANLLDRYSQLADVEALLTDVYPGSRIKITVAGNTEEFVVKGVVKAKVEPVSGSIFMKQEALKRLTGNTTSDANEIAVRADVPGNEYQIQQDLEAGDFASYAKIQTYDEGEPSFVKDMKKLFGVLGTMFGSITLVVAAITVFIIIFINALTRRKYIGILKGIGIRGGAIEIAYVLQSFLYAIIGIAIGSVIVFVFLKPALDAHPIDFPFSDGILVATPLGTSLRALTLLIISIVAAYLPARMIINQNTLDAILGRTSTKKKKIKLHSIEKVGEVPGDVELVVDTISTVTKSTQ